MERATFLKIDFLEQQPIVHHFRPFRDGIYLKLGAHLLLSDRADVDAPEREVYGSDEKLHDS